jgi:hypothetical protein
MKLTAETVNLRNKLQAKTQQVYDLRDKHTASQSSFDARVQRFR